MGRRVMTPPSAGWPRLGMSAAVLVWSLAACDAAPDLQQKRIESPVRADSVNVTVGPLRLLGLRIETPADAVHVEGENVGMFVTIANSAPASDTLVGASTVDARAIVFRDGDGEVRSRLQVDIPAGGVTSLQYPGGPHLELVGMKRDVPGGRFLAVTFRFAKAGVTTVDVFVQGFAHPTVAPPSAPPTP